MGKLATQLTLILKGRLRLLDETRISLDLHHDEVGDIALHLPRFGLYD